jgi:hypothetical protein
VDLRLYFQVLSRFRWLIACGLVLANALAFLTIVHVAFPDGSLGPKFEYREQEIWESRSRVVLTQRGFPWGRAILRPEQGDPGRLYGLADLYAQFAKSDRARKLAERDGPLPGSFTAEAVAGTHGSLPFVTITATSTSPGAAMEVADRGAEALRRYVVSHQNAARIKPKSRVYLDTVWRARPAQLVQARRMTLSVVVFLTVMIAVIALAFVLENLRPRVRTIEGAREPTAVPEARRSA